MFPSTPPVELLAFVETVRQAIGRRDPAAIARVSHFPLVILDAGHETHIRNARELAQRFDQAFTPAVLRRVAQGEPCSMQAVADEGLYYAQTLNFSERVVGRIRLEQIWQRGVD